MNTHATIEELLDVLFSVQSLSYQRKVGDSSSQNFCIILFIIFLFFPFFNYLRNLYTSLMTSFISYF
jgi:hypothetical protein